MNQSNPNLKSILKKLCDLYVLYNIQDLFALFLEEEYMTKDQTQMIRRQVVKVCKEVREDAGFEE